MTLIEQIQDMQRELDYYRNLASKHKLPMYNTDNDSSKLIIAPPEALNYFSKENYLQLSPKYYSTCKMVWGNFSESIDVSFDQIKGKHVVDYIISLQDSGKSKSTRDVYLKALKNVFKVMYRYFSDDIAVPDKDPTDGVVIRMTEEEKQIDVDNKRKHLNMDEFVKIRDTKLKGYLDVVRHVFLFQCYTGLAYNELKEFNPDVHVLNVIGSNVRRIRIRRKKTKGSSGMPSNIPVLSETEALLDYFNRFDKSYEKFIPLKSSYYYYLNKMSEELELEVSITSHWGRHTFVYLMLMRGYTLEEVSSMLGHVSLDTTKNSYGGIQWDHIDKKTKEIELK